MFRAEYDLLLSRNHNGIHLEAMRASLYDTEY